MRGFSGLTIWAAALCVFGHTVLHTIRVVMLWYCTDSTVLIVLL